MWVGCWTSARRQPSCSSGWAPRRDRRGEDRWLSESRRRSRRRPSSDEEVVEEAPPTSEQGEKIKAELDDLLDEIDEVLETNAEDFVKSYVQKGGAVAARRRVDLLGDDGVRWPVASPP